MHRPAANVVNGIILGYTLFYVLADPIRLDREERNITVLQSRENATLGILTDLEKFSIYSLQIAAFTSKGLGPRTAVSLPVQTLEDSKSTFYLCFLFLKSCCFMLARFSNLWLLSCCFYVPLFNPI